MSLWLIIFSKLVQKLILSYIKDIRHVPRLQMPSSSTQGTIIEGQEVEFIVSYEHLVQSLIKISLLGVLLKYFVGEVNNDFSAYRC